MTSWIGADVSGNFLAVDGTTSATYLGGGAAAFADSFLGVRGYWGQVLQLLFGYTGRQHRGDVRARDRRAGFVYLTVRRVIDWRIPLSYLLTAAVMALICYGDAGEILLQLLSGGLLFGAVFMATDYATSPKWRYNRILYGIGLGIVTMLIRAFGTYPEGVSLAILIMNLLVPLMDKYILPVRFGELTKRGKPETRDHEVDDARSFMRHGVGACRCRTPFWRRVRFRRLRRNTCRATSGRTRRIALKRQGRRISWTGIRRNLPLRCTSTRRRARSQRSSPVKQSTMGYTAELAFFIGRTRAQIEGLTDLSTDATTSATRTNTALRAMVSRVF